MFRPMILSKSLNSNETICPGEVFSQEHAESGRDRRVFLTVSVRWILGYQDWRSGAACGFIVRPHSQHYFV